MGPGVLVYAIRALEDATKNIIEKEKINKVEDRIKKCAIAASVAGVGSGMLPGVGSIIATTACVAAIWSMYVLINKDLGISIKNNVLKSLASAFLTNIIASAGSFILGKVAGFLLSFLPGFGTAGAIVVEGKFDEIFNSISKYELPKQNIFFDGQLFDAHILISTLIESAENRIVLIDNYIDESVLVLLSKRKANVSAKIYTLQVSRTFRQDIQSYNSQYPPIDVVQYTKAHDRFLIIDDKVYHVGASIKDLGKKLCAISLLSCINADEMINRIQ